MKQVLLTIAALWMGLTTIQAEDYSYLTFELSDGTKTSVSVTSLSLTVSGTTLTAGQQSFTLTNLNKMYFSTTDESTTTGIRTLTATEMNEITDIYDLNGRRVSKDQMKHGVYIVSTKNGNFKIAVK